MREYYRFNLSIGSTIGRVDKEWIDVFESESIEYLLPFGIVQVLSFPFFPAPKADKKLVEKKPTIKKATTSEKAPAEKKPKATKKLSKEVGASSIAKKKRHKKSVDTYKIYIFKVCEASSL